MEKFKNFLYDKSDLLVALIIVAAAAVIIWFSINNIMEPIAAESDDTASGKAQTEESTDATTTSGAAVTGSAADSKLDNGQQTDQGSAKAAKIIISAGESSDQIAEKLLAAGVITDKNAFFSKLDELGIAGKIQEGSFEIPAGSTLEQVCKIITKTN